MEEGVAGNTACVPIVKQSSRIADLANAWDERIAIVLEGGDISKLRHG